MPSLATQIVMLIGIAFYFWLGLLSIFHRANIPLAGFVAAALSWVIATMSLGWALHVLRLTGHWPLV
jgi:hypothetical protein